MIEITQKPSGNPLMPSCILHSIKELLGFPDVKGIYSDMESEPHGVWDMELDEPPLVFLAEVTFLPKLNVVIAAVRVFICSDKTWTNL